jgi:hypothetical protein
MSSGQRRYNLLLIVPTIAILLTGAYAALLNGQAAPQDSSKANSVTPSNNDDSYISLSSVKDSYQYGDIITINGTLINGTSKTGIPNNTILIEAFAGENEIYKSYAITDGGGRFSNSFKVQELGDVRITAKVSANTSVPDAIISIPVKSQIDGVAMLIVITLIVVPMVALLLAPPKYQPYSVLGAVLSLGVGLVYLNTAVSLGQALTAALSTALFVPLGTHIFDFLNKKRQTESSRESAAAEYRNKNLQVEVTSLIKIYEEVCQHQSVFKQKDYDDFSVRLMSKNYESQSIVGTMANLPALRINTYYRYISLYNACLDYKSSKSGYIKNVKLFDENFKKFKERYLELETILYVNIIYSIAEIHQRFFSFPTVKLPMRISRPLYWELLVSRALEGDVLVEEEKQDLKTVVKVIRKRRFRPDEHIGYVFERESSSNSNKKSVSELPNLRDVYDLYKVMKKDEIYEDGIAYKFTTYLEKKFNDKYHDLEVAASKLRLLNLTAYPVSVFCYSTDELKIQLKGSSSDTSQLFFEIRTMPAHGELSVELYGLVTYKPDRWYTGDDSFTFAVTDCVIGSEPAQVSIKVLTGDNSSPVITSTTATPITLGLGDSTIMVRVHITDNIGVSSSSIGVYKKGGDDNTIDSGFHELDLIAGDKKNGDWCGTFTFKDDIADGEYEVKFFAKDAARNQATGASISVTLDRKVRKKSNKRRESQHNRH